MWHPVVTPWHAPRMCGSGRNTMAITSLRALHSFLFTEPATKYFLTDALPRDALDELAKRCYSDTCHLTFRAKSYP